MVETGLGEPPSHRLRPSQPQLSVEIDRERASDLNIPLEDVAQTLRVMVDGARIVDLNADDQTVPIILEAGSDKIRDPSDLVNLYVRTRSGALVPLSSIVRWMSAVLPASRPTTSSGALLRSMSRSNRALRCKPRLTIYLNSLTKYCPTV